MSSIDRTVTCAKAPEKVVLSTVNIPDPNIADSGPAIELDNGMLINAENFMAFLNRNAN